MVAHGGAHDSYSGDCFASQCNGEPLDVYFHYIKYEVKYYLADSKYPNRIGYPAPTFGIFKGHHHRTSNINHSSSFVPLKCHWKSIEDLKMNWCPLLAIPHYNPRKQTNIITAHACVCITLFVIVSYMMTISRQGRARRISPWGYRFYIGEFHP